MALEMSQVADQGSRMLGRTVQGMGNSGVRGCWKPKMLGWEEKKAEMDTALKPVWMGWSLAEKLKALGVPPRQMKHLGLVVLLPEAHRHSSSMLERN